MKKKILVLLSVIVAVSSVNGAVKKKAPTPKRESIPETIPVRNYDLSAAERLGWKLCTQGVNFKFAGYNFLQTLQIMKKIGIPYLEACNSHAIGGGHKGNVSYKMSKEQRVLVKQMLKDNDVTLINYGVVSSKRTKEQWRQIFEFSKDMGIETVLAEPAYEDLAYVDSLAQEFNVKVAIHNHAKPTKYWNPDIVTGHLEKLSSHVGIGPDIGNWIRSKIVPFDKISTLEDKIYSIQLKDYISVNGRNYQVAWGAGGSRIMDILIELQRQKYRGAITIEYFKKDDDTVGDMQESIRFFKRACHWLELASKK